MKHEVAKELKVLGIGTDFTKRVRVLLAKENHIWFIEFRAGLDTTWVIAGDEYYSLPANLNTVLHTYGWIARMNDYHFQVIGGM